MVRVSMKRYLSFIVVVLILLSAMTGVCAGEADAGEQPTASAEESTSPDATGEELSYRDYWEKNGEAVYNGEIIEVPVMEPLESNIDQEEGTAGYMTEEDSVVTWRFTVEKSGAYLIRIQYHLVEGLGDYIERRLLIDGELPFVEAGSLMLSRVYTWDKEIEPSADGNDIRPRVEEVFESRTETLWDTSGYNGDAMVFALEAGEHTLTLESLQEPMLIEKIELISQSPEPVSYAEYRENVVPDDAKEASGVLADGIKTFQGENATRVSDRSVFVRNDRSSSATVPYHYSKVRYNALYTGDRLGQWFEMEIDVPADGLYSISFRVKQDGMRGLYSSRRLLIDEEIPFKEAEALNFLYDTDWQMVTLGNGTEPYLFYLEEGKHTLTLEFTLGDMADILYGAEETLDQLNQAIYDMMTLMGSTPDENRNYRVPERLPQVMDILNEEMANLNEMEQYLLDSTGQRDNSTATIAQLAEIMRKMIERPIRIPSYYAQFKDAVSGFSDWILTAKGVPMLLDYVVVSEPGATLPKAESGFWDKLKFGVLSFVSSFFEDYSSVGSTGDGNGETITVWYPTLTSGREQAMSLKLLVNQYFTQETGINVNLQMVQSGTLLTASLAGKGPDVSLQTAAADPVNYALRGAVLDLSQFEGYDEVSKRFAPGSLVPYQFNGGVYALPETASFMMMFYRQDILEDMGIDIDSIQTWQDLMEILPTLQKSHLDIGLTADTNSFYTILMQMGGSLYRDDGRYSNLDSDVALEAFRMWTQLYTNYQIPQYFSAQTRFRTGEMPIMFFDYTLYNTLSVFAPEINGLWGMRELPGFEDENGNIVNSIPISGLGSIIMSSTDSPEACWKFLEWLTRAETQIMYGREIESVLGIASRYNTANVEAIRQLPWTRQDREVLLSQLENTVGIPEVPGGYYMPRSIEFAIRKVLDKGFDPKEALLEYVPAINTEIRYKRDEFGLD